MILSDLAIAGNYSNGQSRSLVSSLFELKQFSFTIDSSYFNGKCKLRNFTSPELQLNSTINIDMAQVQDFFKFDTIEKASGNLRSTFWLDARFNNIKKPSLEELQNMKLSGESYLENGELKLYGSEHHFTHIETKAVFADNDLRLSNLSFVDGINKIRLEGLITNFFPYLLVDSQKMFIDANLFAEYFDMEDYLLAGETKEQDIADTIAIEFPDDISFSIGLDMNNFVYKKFKAYGLQGLVHYKNKTLTTKEIQFNTMTGKASANGVLQQNPEHDLQLKLNSKLQTIDINQLFHSFDNFKQEFLLKENLAGKISGDVKFAMRWDEKQNVIREDIFAEGELIIRDGELIDFEPMQSLSRFADVEELKHIRFSELKNTIYIKNQKIIIPKMLIASSAFNLGISGEHSFNNDIDYHINVLLSEVLSKRFKRRKPKDQEFVNIEDDGLGRTTLFLAIRGTVDDYKVNYDRKKSRNKIKENLKEERNEMRSIIKEEFSKKDGSHRKKKNEEDESPQMIFEFEGDTIK